MDRYRYNVVKLLVGIKARTGPALFGKVDASSVHPIPQPALVIGGGKRDPRW